MWTYRSPIGLMRIFCNGRNYSLEIGGIVYAFFASPEQAADDVASFATDCYEWDSLCEYIIDYPADLSEWETLQ